jgi:hypothetical protein
MLLNPLLDQVLTVCSVPIVDDEDHSDEVIFLEPKLFNQTLTVEEKAELKKRRDRALANLSSEGRSNR